jgi:hypothetical protein
MGSFSVWHWLIVLAIISLVFGTSRLRNIGSDLGLLPSKASRTERRKGNRFAIECRSTSCTKWWCKPRDVPPSLNEAR